MEYKYQIGEIVYDQHAACVITAHGVYQDGDVAVPYYQATSVTVPLGTRNLPLTDERIHRDEYMKQWYREGLLSGVEEYYEDRVKHFEERKQLLEQDIQAVEEKIKRFKGLLNPGNDSPSGYVIRTHYLVNPDAILGFVAMEGELGRSRGHLARKVYASELAAIEDAEKYNRLNPSLCFAVVIPNGTEKDCLTAKPLWEEEQ